jgi:hypothetical protein
MRGEVCYRLPVTGHQASTRRFPGYWLPGTVTPPLGGWGVKR